MEYHELIVDARHLVRWILESQTKTKLSNMLRIKETEQVSLAHEAQIRTGQISLTSRRVTLWTVV